MTVLSGTGLTRLYGDPCGDCESLTGDDAGRNRCPACGTIVACADVSLDIERGEVLGVVGESGSGKSSLAELLALERGEGHSRGSVRFDGYEGNLLESDYDTRTRLRNDDLALVHQHNWRCRSTGWTTPPKPTPGACSGESSSPGRW